jgi:hypothetical protein
MFHFIVLLYYVDAVCHYTILYYIILYCTTLHYIALQFSTPYEAIPYHTILYHTLQHYTAPYYILYCILRYSTLYYVMLCYTKRNSQCRTVLYLPVLAQADKGWFSQRTTRFCPGSRWVRFVVNQWHWSRFLSVLRFHITNAHCITRRFRRRVTVWRGVD